MALYTNANSPKWIKAFTVDAGSVSANSYLDVNLSTTFKPAKVNDMFIVFAPSLDGGLIISPGIVSTAGTVTARINNVTGSPINPASQVYIAVCL
jgi:hypothetical protein